MKTKPYFTRKNLIILSLAFIYALVLMYTAICLGAAANFRLNRNALQAVRDLFGLPSDPAWTTTNLLMVFLVAIYVIVFVAVVLYEMRYAVVNGKKKFSWLMVGIYAGSFVGCVIMSIGVGILIQRPFNVEAIKLAFGFLGQCLIVATFIYIIAAIVVGGILLFVVNFILIDKPFRFFKEEDRPVLDDAEFIDEDIDVSSSFDDVEVDGTLGAGGGVGGAGGGAGGAGFGDGENNVVRQADKLDDREKVFPSLSRIDVKYDGFINETVYSDNYSLEEIATKFRNYLAKVEGLYFDIEVIRYFISAFAASHFVILEGLSGTGKSSLPRYFMKFINGQVLFMPVQATWRDKTNILGYFSDFSKTYSETEFLEKLYSANYNPDVVHMFVLDEMNISRVEYYFADLLSVLEFPVPDWKLKVMNFPHDFIPPVKLEDGYIQITPNSYFIGTANKDDSTFTITDKVYDRAITIDFEERNTPFTVNEEAGTINLSASKLHELYYEAMNNQENHMSDADYKKFNKITDFVYEEFDIAIGNRIMNQVENLVPVYVACGGTKEEAVDFLLSRKLIAKIEGRFEEYVKGALKQLNALIAETYGEGTLKRCEKTIKSLMRRL